MGEKGKNRAEIIEVDCGIIGGGLAGCSAALELAKAGKKVALFVKGKLVEDGNSYLLAGGLTAVDENKKSADSFALHVKDTLAAGKGLNDPQVVKFCAERFYPDVIHWLSELGVSFDKGTGCGGFDLHREGGHSKERIYHVQDTTGKSIMQVLGAKVIESKNVTVFEEHMAIDLITKKKLSIAGSDACLGFYIYDIKNGVVKTVKCSSTFVGTGGLGKVFLYTSNSDAATADGFAMAYRIGLPLANMEFIQFHPTVFYDPRAESEGERRFLLTEALRWAGAILKLSKDAEEDFVLKHDQLGSKATRDVVSRAEDVEMRRLGLPHVWLDCTKIPAERLRNDFKNTYDFCMRKGIDITKEPVPVVYAEHYSNGGVLVSKNSETTIKGCYVIGESSYTGLHGATRLASNSGPECVLFGRLAAKHFLKENVNKDSQKIDVPLWDSGRAVKLKDKIAVQYYWMIVRNTMNSLCGMSRNEQRLRAALHIIQALEEHIHEFYWTYKVNKDFLEVRNIACVVEVILKSALAREESRACHVREDFPKVDDKFLGITLVERGKAPFIQKF